MKTYLVQLPDHTSVRVEAEHYEIEAGGVLLFGDEEGFLVRGFGPGAWTTVQPA